MKFFVGHHHVAKAQHIPRAFLSVNTLWDRKADFKANDWIMDSGAFSELLIHGEYREERSVKNYAQQIFRWSRCGNMLRAVSQDYMCEPNMLAITGMTMEMHQHLTISRYILLQAYCGSLIMPVLQGQEPQDYIAHIEMYGAILKPGTWTGVGSVCKRKDESSIREVLRAIKAVRPDLKLHGFGLKTSALRCAEVWDTLYSADSMAWSYRERMKRRDGLPADPNGLAPALKFAETIDSMPRQEVLL